MSTCYPKPGSVKVSDGEVLTVVSNYSSDRQHTGVMGLLYILVAEQEQPAPKPALCFSFPVPCKLNKIINMVHAPFLAILMLILRICRVLTDMADEQSLNVQVGPEEDDA